MNSLNSRGGGNHQERSRDTTSANSHSLLKTPQSINSSKGLSVVDRLPPLFSTNKSKILVGTNGLGGELNVIHEKLPFSQIKSN
jgi:hypothetical protein